MLSARPALRGAADGLRRAALSLLDLRLLLLIGACVGLLLLLAQLPLAYQFQVGQERGVGSDEPFLDSFNPAEGSGSERFRWSQGESTIALPGVGRRSMILGLGIVSHRAQWDASAPATIVELRAGGASVPLELRREGARYRIYLPPRMFAGGALRLTLKTEPWRSPGDNRAELGVALGGPLTLVSTRGGGLVLPDRALLLGLSAGLALLWMALAALGFARTLLLALLMPVALAAPLLMLLDAPRLGFAAAWAVQAGALALLAALLCAWLVPPLLHRLGALPPPALLRWLLLLVVLSFALKYGGRLYPDSMPGDIQLHVNRYNMTVVGDVYIRAQHRGLPFPFPPALYLLLAPLTLAGLDVRLLLQLSAGIFEATTVLLLYLLLRRLSGSAQLGLLSAAIYALTAAGHMTTWFAFETQVATQWFTTLLIVVLALRWPDYRGLTWWLLLLLFVQVFLGHIGQFINTSLAGLLLVPLLWLRAKRPAERQGVLCLAGVGFAAGLFVAAFYYTAFLDLIMTQVAGVASEGLVEVTGRRPIPRAETLWVLWQGGLIDHLGFFPAVLALVGALLLGRSRLRGTLLPPLVWACFLVSLAQAALPLITLSSITTRWLMFSVWAITAAGALGLLLLWRRGRAARLVSLAMAAYVSWLTLGVWIEAMALRKPPIEPF